MKKIGAGCMTLALVLVFSASAWGATAGFELALSNLSVRLNGDGTFLVPSSVNGYAQIAGWAGCPLERVPDYLTQPQWGTHNLSSSYSGGPWLQEMSTSGVYNPITNSASTSAKIVCTAPFSGPENVSYWGNERSFVEQGAWSIFYLNFSSLHDGWYQAHVSADYTYTVTLDNSGPNTFGELNWAPDLVIGLHPPYWIEPNYDITEIFADKTPGTHSGHLDLDIGPEVYLFAGNIMGVVMATDLTTQNWGRLAVPIPASIFLLGSGLLGLAGRKLQRKLYRRRGLYFP